MNRPKRKRESVPLGDLLGEFFGEHAAESCFADALADLPTPDFSKADELAREDDRARLAARTRRWVDCGGVEEDAAQAIFRGELDNTPARQIVHRWQSSRSRPWLWMSGGRGVGKTWAATEWLMCNSMPNTTGRLVTGAEMLRRWVKGEDTWDEIARIQLLVVDDPDIPDGEPKAWYSVLEQRYRRKLPTIITSNALDDKAWWDWWGEGFASRLQSRFHKIAETHQVGGRDLRIDQKR